MIDDIDSKWQLAKHWVIIWSRVLFIAHNPKVSELAILRMEITNVKTSLSFSINEIVSLSFHTFWVLNVNYKTFSDMAGY